jgi:hypothetical protein
MSRKERDRLIVMEAVKSGRITLAEAAARMGVSERQAIRIKAQYLAEGAAGLVHRARGRIPGNRSAAPELHDGAIALYRRQYADFGPTLAAEKLTERDGLVVHHETLRRWLVASGDWTVGTPGRKHRRRRPRRARFGQLLQIDGSDHAWLEERGPRCCLMVLTDDATGRMGLHLAATETTAAALALLRAWVERHGVPEAIYSDRKSVYWSPGALENPARRGDRRVHSEWGGVAVGLGIALIPAYSPQAKGRVERLNGTLQDRLVKELRLRGINTIEAANAVLSQIAGELNAKLARPAAEALDAHRVFAPASQEERELAFSPWAERVVARDWTVTLDGVVWQIPKGSDASKQDLPQPGAKVTLARGMDGVVRCLWQGRPLAIERCRRAEEKFRETCGFDLADAAA